MDDSGKVGTGEHAPTLRPRADIQGLRGIAVLLVVLDHAGVPWFRGGYIGVDVFFVVSGFLITSLLLRDADAGRVRLGVFYARRARRILPAASVVLVATSVYAALELSVSRIHEVVQDVSWSAFFVANVHFAGLGTDYFQQGRAPSPVQHFWSLAVEEQFYLVWPVLLAVLVLARRSRRWVVAFVLLAWVASATSSVLLTAREPADAYFASTTRAWELATGALLAVGAGRLEHLGAASRVALSALGLASVGSAAVAYGPGTAFPGWAAAVPVGGTAAVLAAGTGTAQRGLGRVVSLRSVCWVGDVSYSLYLWHWPILVLARERWGTALSPAATGALVVLAVVISAASYHLVENPLRHGRLVRGRRALILWPVALSAVVVSVVWANARAASVTASLARASAAYDAAYPRVSAPGSASVGQATPSVPARVRAAVRRAAAGAPVPYPLDNGGRLGRDLWQFRYRCTADWERTSSDLCPVGDEQASTTLVVYGDSHAGMWLPALDALGAREHFRVIPLVKFGCGPFDVTQLHDGHAYPECAAWRSWALTRIAQLRPAAVVLAYRSLLYVDPPAGSTREDAWTAGVSSALASLAPLTDEVEIVSDIPDLGFDPADCVTRPGARLRSCMGSPRGDMAVGNELTGSAAHAAGVRFVDVTDLVCADGRCPVVVERTVLYRDDAHLTMTWVRQLTDAVGQRLRLDAAVPPLARAPVTRRR